MDYLGKNHQERLVMGHEEQMQEEEIYIIDKILNPIEGEEMNARP